MPSRSPTWVRPRGIVTASDALPDSWRRGLRAVRPGTWLRAGTFGLVAAFVIAIPTRLVPNGFFSRMTPVRPLDYVLLIISSGILGLTLALRSAGTGADRSSSPSFWPAGAGAAGTRAVTGGIGTVFAVGCPVCNKLVVALLGTGGALSVFAPLQPVIGLAAVGLLAFGLAHQLRVLGATVCQPPIEN